MTEAPLVGRPAGGAPWGLTRPQVTAFTVAAVGAAGVLVSRGHALALVGLVLVAAASGVGRPGRSGVDRATTAVAFLARSRWTYVTVTPVDGLWRVRARGVATCAVGVVHHRGRLDLAGVDGDLGADLRALADQVAESDGPRHLSWHVLGGTDPATTIVASPPGSLAVRHVDGARATGDVVPALLGSLATGGWLLERWRYARAVTDVVAVFAVRAVAPGAGRGSLWRLAPPGSARDVHVHARVAGAREARAIVGRQSHRLGADAALSALAGFRRRATTDAAAATLARRERDVAEGRALVRVAVFVTVRAPTSRDLERAIATLRADARRLGVDLERGDGRHAPWLCASLPGGGSWRS